MSDGNQSSLIPSGQPIGNSSLSIPVHGSGDTSK